MASSERRAQLVCPNSFVFRILSNSSRRSSRVAPPSRLNTEPIHVCIRPSSDMHNLISVSFAPLDCMNFIISAGDLHDRWKSKDSFLILSSVWSSFHFTLDYGFAHAYQHYSSSVRFSSLFFEILFFIFTLLPISIFDPLHTCSNNLSRVALKVGSVWLESVPR